MKGDKKGDNRWEWRIYTPNPRAYESENPSSHQFYLVSTQFLSTVFHSISSH